MKNLTTSVYTFKDLIEDNYTYVDKTGYIYELVKQPKGLYFLSRPRRFGKSLLISTLKSIFSGQKELFKGLKIYTKDYSWEKYPVIHLELGGKEINTANDLREFLRNRILKVASDFQVSLRTTSYEEMFQELIEKVGSEKKVVILVDEYDKPILSNATNPKVKEILKVLKAFYSVIKSTESYQRFVLLTGVSKFSKVSVFSDLNNLTDLTMDQAFSTALGYTQEELESYFADYILQLTKQEDEPKSELLEKMKQWYNGYRFSRAANSVYNPVSIMNLFINREFRNYWFETGTPTFLLDLMKKFDYDIQNLEHLELTEIGFSAYEIDDLYPEPLLFQTGYLTIKDYDKETMLYTLSYPNAEVNNAFAQHLMGTFTPVRKELAVSHIVKLLQAIKKADVNSFLEHMKVFFANIPNNITLKSEKYYQTIFYLIFKLLGIYIDAEVNTNQGRIDAVVKTSSCIFIFEFKLQGTSEEALQQINDKTYYEKYLNDGKTIVLTGVAFDPETRNIEDWLINK